MFQSQIASTSGHNNAVRREAIRFNSSRDVALLEQLKEYDPFSAARPNVVWGAVATALNRKLGVNGTDRTYMDRLKLLLKKHRKSETESLKRYIYKVINE